MKKILLLFSLLLIQFAVAQNITFADTNFKNLLLASKIDYNDPYFTGEFINYPSIDSNNDGEISQAEALLVIRLDMGYAEINDLSGLEYFTNLEGFNSLYFNSSSFNFPTLVNLENLTLSDAVSGLSNLTSLDLSSNINLKKVSCSVYGNINLNNLTNLKSLSIFGTFTEIDLSDCINLLELYLTAPLTELNLSSNTKLVNLNIANSDFTTINLSSCPNLEIVYINKTEMETLNLGSIKHIRYLFVQENKLTSLDTSFLFNLQNLNCDNNDLNYLSVKNNGLIFGDNSGMSFAGNPNLETICCDPNEIVYIQNQCNFLGYDNTVVSDCAQPQITLKTVTMFPNPVKDMLHLDSAEKINKVEVFGSNGLLIMTSENVSDVVDMQALQSGIYFLKIYRDIDVSQMKFMKG
ncbi:MAG: T9SS type A sorting domain-containing protein [Flavobacterium sp.]|uniref:T9SS type A sorting domain-containing protein n=1 Tax=Flavobacterium sp. TaxID=239 RepID=UPI0022BD8791|nr:T9SS type A sorting domain-containing protein [Flavobacterium sp.]MCZ8196436.1 T9SS type A sorting domain-containing protein [Flavobacterium sp.]